MNNIKVDIGKEILVHSPPVNENTKKWGVYAIPRLWRELNGELVVRFNGEMDCGDTDNMQKAPNLYFVSIDEGESWHFLEDGDSKYDISVLNGLDAPYLRLKDRIIAFRERAGVKPISGVTAQKSFVTPCLEALVHSYKYGDIADESKGAQMLIYKKDSNECEIIDVDIDFPEREILINVKGNDGDKFVDVVQKMRQSIFKNPYFSTPISLSDGTLVAVSCGQHPDVCDHYNGVAYLLESSDNGKNWKKRSVIAADSSLKYGYSGDGHEVSLAVSESGRIFCGMRMEMSINPNTEQPICDMMVTYSDDNGYTWKKPFSVSDSSVTPHIICLKNNIVVAVYGRPGVHFKVSCDNGETWSDSYSIIGKTLEECRAENINDADSKYFKTSSYSNTFVEKLSADSFLILYNNMQYDEGDGVFHKAAFVRKVTITFL